eukprot:8341869-Pyramimonas_sp.AAC.1
MWRGHAGAVLLKSAPPHRPRPPPTTLRQNGRASRGGQAQLTFLRSDPTRVSTRRAKDPRAKRYLREAAPTRGYPTLLVGPTGLGA